MKKKLLKLYLVFYWNRFKSLFIKEKREKSLSFIYENDRDNKDES